MAGSVLAAPPDIGTLAKPRRKIGKPSAQCIAEMRRKVPNIPAINRTCMAPQGLPNVDFNPKDRGKRVIFDRKGDIPADKILDPDYTYQKTPSEKQGSSQNPRVLTSRIFDVTVIKSGFRPETAVDIKITGIATSSDNGTIALVHFNGALIGPAELSPGVETVFRLRNFRRGANVLKVSLSLPDILDSASFSVDFDQTDMVGFGQVTPYDERSSFVRTLFPVFSQSTQITIGFPQIGFSASAYPESAQHVRDVWSYPPASNLPRTAPLIKKDPPLSHNPYPPRGEAYPRLLTVDRPGTNFRRGRSLANYTSCPTKNGATQNRDEFPPAVFRENNGTAHIKCINASDNKGSGATFGGLLNFYQSSPTVRNKKIQDGDVVEFVLF